jgi:hypothetical protein
MAEIDVSDIALDPMVAGETFQVLRRQDTINDFGESSTQDVLLPGVGAVFPSGDNSLLREEAFQTMQNVITVVTQFALRGSGVDESGTKFQPDIVLWGGNYYQVRSTNNFNQYGAGFVEAECISIDYQLVERTLE